jgi:hypothetical protein
MLLTTIALQALKLTEFISRRERAKKDESISRFVPVNPKTNERLLSQFDNLHLKVEEKEKKVLGTLVDIMTSLQKWITITTK